MSLEPELRKQARRKGRKIISEAPGLEKAAGHLVPLPPHTTLRRWRWRRRYEQCKRRVLLWPPETPPCPVCKMWGKLPKRSWPRWDLAEEVRLRQNEPSLRTYECPAQPGYWHLGHLPRSKISVSAGNLTSP